MQDDQNELMKLRSDLGQARAALEAISEMVDPGRSLSTVQGIRDLPERVRSLLNEIRIGEDIMDDRNRSIRELERELETCCNIIDDQEANTNLLRRELERLGRKLAVAHGSQEHAPPGWTYGPVVSSSLYRDIWYREGIGHVEKDRDREFWRYPGGRFGSDWSKKKFDSALDVMEAVNLELEGNSSDNSQS